jgi:hypothetical protein
MAQRSSVSFASANIPGPPLESVFRQDEEDGLRGKAERAGATWLLPSLVKPGSMTAVSPKAFSSSSQLA